MSEGNKLPNPLSALIEETKLRLYLLNLGHPQGGSKARFFINRGFSLEHWGKLREALIKQGTDNEVVQIVEHEFGRRYTVECNCPTPDGLNPCIRSVWEVKSPTSEPRLITAHPLSK